MLDCAGERKISQRKSHWNWGRVNEPAAAVLPGLAFLLRTLASQIWSAKTKPTKMLHLSISCLSNKTKTTEPQSGFPLLSQKKPHSTQQNKHINFYWASICQWKMKTTFKLVERNTTSEHTIFCSLSWHKRGNEGIFAHLVKPDKIFLIFLCFAFSPNFFPPEFVQNTHFPWLEKVFSIFQTEFESYNHLTSKISQIWIWNGVGIYQCVGKPVQLGSLCRHPMIKWFLFKFSCQIKVALLNGFSAWFVLRRENLIEWDSVSSLHLVWYFHTQNGNNWTTSESHKWTFSAQV